MSSEWKQLTLGDVTTWSSGGTPKKDIDAYWNGDIPWISANSMHGTRFSDSDLKITEAGLKNGSRLAERNSILLLVRGGALHSRIPVGIAMRDVAFNQDVKSLRAKEEFISPWFLLFWLMAHERFLLDSVVEYTGIGAGKLDTKRMQSLPFLVPPQEEMIAIEQIAKSIDERINLLRETNATLEAIAQALFKSWFVDFDPVHANAGTQAPSLPPEIQALFPATFTDSPQGPIPEGWKLVPFGDLLTHTIGGDWGDELPTEKNEVRVAIIRGTDLPDLAAGNAERVPIRYTSAKKLASRKLQDGDLVLEVSGGSKDQPTGRSLYLTNGILSQFDCPMEPASFCRLLRPESHNISVVLAQHMTYIYAQGKTWEYQNQSTGISNFQTTHFLESERVVVPSDEVLKVFAENVRPMIDRAHLTQISKLTALRDTLLPRLISGQLRLPEAEQAVAAITD